MKPLKTNIVDRVVAIFRPNTAIRMAEARTRFAALTAATAAQGGYTAGRRDRRGLAQWFAGNGSADSDLLPDLATMRERSRDLERNNPLAAAPINTEITNVVGTGLRLRPRIDREVLGLDAEQANAYERQIRRWHLIWCHALNCDVTRTQHFHQMQRLALRGQLVSGDIFFPKRFMDPLRPGALFGFCLQAIEADRVCNPDWKSDGYEMPGGNTVWGGVERDTDGAPVAYHILRTHPGELRPKAHQWDRVPAFTRDGRRNVIHLFDRKRPGQTRGEPVLAVVVEALKEVGLYVEAERLAAVIAAKPTLFVETANGEGLAPGSNDSSTATGVAGYAEKLMESALIFDLMPGDKISAPVPGRPNASFAPFVEALSNFCGAALEMPTSIFLKKFTASYSASRAELLEAWKKFRTVRADLARSFCDDVHEDVLIEAVARGYLTLPGFIEDPVKRRAWLGADWIGPSPGQIDPLKEVDAAIKRVRELRISSRTREAAEVVGDDFEDIVDELDAEEANLDRRGLLPSSNSPAPALPAPDQSAPPASGRDTDDEDETREEKSA